MAKTTEQLLQQAVQIRDEQANKKNTALRVGTLFSDIIQKQDEDVTALDKSVKDNKEKLTELENSISEVAGKTIYNTYIDITTIKNGSEISVEQQKELDRIFASTMPVYLKHVGFYEKTTDGLWTKTLVLRKESATYIADVTSTIWSIAVVKTDKELDGESYNPIANAPVQQAITSLSSKVDTQLPAIEEAKNEAIESINQNEQSAISNFNAQRVTPEMLSESTKQLIEASGGGTITNLPDDEDLESVDDGTGSNVLKFRNKAYSAENFSGMGRVYLRKNIVEGKNVLTQEMISEENVIYHIEYDYDLNGAEINVPKNCVLQFNGGSFRNGTINGNFTKIEALPYNIFADSISLNGSFDGTKIYAEWFGAKSLYSKTTASSEYVEFKEVSIPSETYELPDAAPAINEALKMSQLGGGEVEMLSRIYHIKTTVEIIFRSVLHTQNDTLFVVNMNGTATTKVKHSETDASMTDITSEEAYYTLSRNEYLKTDSMAIAFNMHPVKTKFYGGGSITLYPSRHTIGIHIYSIGYWYMDMTYYTPIIDMVICGEKKNISSPDPRDLVGTGEPTTEIGSGNTEVIYYWDKQGKKYYKRAVGGEWTLANGEADPHWNTCMRIETTTGSSGGRIVNPHINCRMIYGARGLEVIVRDSSGTAWFNESWVEGSITEMYSNYISVFCEKNLSCDAHDWQKLVIQSSNKGMYDSAMFYAIRSGSIKLGHFWDVSWNASKQKENYYFGKETKNIVLSWVDGKVTDLGQDNSWGQKSFDYSAKDPLLKTMWRNIWNKYIPNGTIYGGILKSILAEDDINENHLKSEVEGQTPSKYIFDSDLSTYCRVIDTKDSKYGFYLNCYPQYKDSIEKMTRYNYVLAIKYKFGNSNADWGKLKCKVFGERPTSSNFSLDVVLNKGVSYNQISTNYLTDTTFVNIPYNNVRNLQVLIYTEEDVDFTVDLVGLELWIDSLSPEYANLINPNHTLPTAAPFGFSCMHNGTLYVNKGDSENPIWRYASERLITFEDKEVASILANKYGDGDNVMAYTLAEITSLSNIFKGNTNIQSFTELSEFSKLTELKANEFYGCTNLESIDLYNIETIADNSFYNCTSLVSIGNTKKIKSIGSLAFMKCNFTTIDLPSLESIRPNAFQGVPLQKVINLGKITELPNGTNYQGLFANNSSLELVRLPSTITNIGDHSFRYSHQKLKLIVESINPPTLSNSAFTGKPIAIYVPDESVESYKEADIWSTYTDIIKPLSEYE